MTLKSRYRQYNGPYVQGQTIQWPLSLRTDNTMALKSKDRQYNDP